MKTQTVNTATPRCAQARAQLRSESTPCLWPAMRGRAALGPSPLPSMTRDVVCTTADHTCKRSESPWVSLQTAMISCSWRHQCIYLQDVPVGNFCTSVSARFGLFRRQLVLHQLLDRLVASRRRLRTRSWRSRLRAGRWSFLRRSSPWRHRHAIRSPIDAGSARSLSRRLFDLGAMPFSRAGR